MKNFLNYLGQLRIYSFLDLIIFATALTKDLNTIIGIALLWLSFLFYLESRHNDEPRLRVNKYIWLAPFIFSLILLPILMCLGFAIFSFLYANKKKGEFWGASAPLWRGLQNGVIAIWLSPQLAILAFVLTFIRNLVADFRDVYSDKQRGIKTIPVLLGINKNHVWAFYTYIILVITTTMIWFNYSFLTTKFIVPIIILQLLFYPITPRLSNPKYLDIYNYD